MNTPQAAVSPSHWQWTTSDLLRWTVYLAIFSAMTSYLGLQNPLFWFCSIYALIQTTTFAISVPRRNNVAPLLATALSLFFLVNPLFMFISLVTLLNCVLHLIFLIVVKTQDLLLSPQRVAEISIAMTLVAFGIGICFGIPAYAELLQARKEFAPQDLTQRLSYESRPNGGSLSALSAEQYQNSKWPAFEFEMSQSLEFRDNPVGRKAALQGLHQKRVEAFIKSPGFGIGRFLIPTPARARLPAIVDIPFDRDVAGKPLKYHRYLDNPWPIAQGRELDDFHFMGLKDFFQPASFGIMMEPKVTRGFQPHAYHYRPEFESSDSIDDDRLSLERLQLISLNRFETPRAYELDHLPRMDQLSRDDVPTRRLTEFELNALKKIQNSQDVIIERGEHVIEMAGSIRAIDACIQCHSADPGGLLGMFSYQFKIN